MTSIKRIHANSLLITVVIALLIAILCASLLLLAYNDLAVDRVVQTDNRLQRRMHSAVNLVLADTSLVLSGIPDTVDVFGQGPNAAVITRENWGVFDVARVTVTEHGRSITKSFFFGPAADTPLDACLYLAQHNIPLYVSGNSLLTGDAYLPKAGLQPAYVDQKGFANAQPLTGSIRNSNDSLPPVDARMVALLSRRDTVPTSSPLPDSLQWSFTDAPVIIHRRGPVTLDNCVLNGHILIISDSSILVRAGASLDNVMLEAPFIGFESGCSGTLQAIATDSIAMKNNCHLGYPSCLALLKHPSSKAQPAIRIGDTCSIDGLLLTLIRHAGDPEKTYVELGRNSLLTGYLYTSGFLNLKGTVSGVVLTDYFLYRSPSSVLQNYLVDASITRTALSAYFTGPRLFASTRPNRIIQWVK